MAQLERAWRAAERRWYRAARDAEIQALKAAVNGHAHRAQELRELSERALLRALTARAKLDKRRRF